jgi:hypothetical protein
MSLGLGNILVQQRNSGGSGTTPNLQQVTNVGNNTTNDIRLDFVGEEQAGLFVYDTGYFQNKLFFGIDANGVGQVEYFVTGAINTAMGLSFANNSTIYSFYGDNARMGLILDFALTTYYIGDPDIFINGTALIVDDNNQEIKTKFSGKETSLTNGLHALREKGIIIPREGFKGQYRLQWASFAFWIKNHKN